LPKAKAKAEAKAEDDDMDAVGRAAEATIRRVAPDLERVTKYGAPTFRGNADVCTIGVWTRFVSVGFWRGAELAAKHVQLEGSGKRTRLVKLRTVKEARSRAFSALVRAAVRLDEADASR
jgi:hypothetical protein